MAADAWIVEADSGQEGPIDLTSLRSMHAAGNLAGKRVRPDGSDQFLSDQELGSLLSEAAVTDPPMAAYPRPQPAAKSANEDPLRFVIPLNPSGWAIAAGYLGLFSVLCVPSPIALIVGIIAIRDLAKHPDKTGKGRAWFGAGMGLVGTVFLLLFVVDAIKHAK